MNNSLAYYTIILCSVLLLLINTCSAIKCWDCRSDADSKCANPFNNKTLDITNYNPVKPIQYIFDKNDYKTQKSTMCRKIGQKVNGVWKYFRSCAFLGEIAIKGDERFCLMRTGTYNIFMEYCTCNSKDGCNSSSYTFVSKVVLGLCISANYICANKLCSVLI